MIRATFPVLIISHTDDTHADRVETHLTEMGVPSWRIDTDRWPQNWAVTLQVSNKGICSKLKIGEYDAIGLEEVRSIWYRRIVDPSANLEEDLLRLVVSERKEAIDALLSWYKGFVLCNPLAYRPVDNKIVQTELARQVGLLVPKTLVTSDFDDARDFTSQGPTVFKLQRTVYVEREGRTHTVYTSRLNPQDLDPLRVTATPCLLQEEKQKSFELRVTVVGHNVLACRIDSQASPHTRIDYRKYDFEHVSHDPFELPEEIADKCRELVRVAGLFFASMDMIVTPDQEYFFLDLNPNGQWLWIEELSGMPISQAIADILANPPIHEDQASGLI